MVVRKNDAESARWELFVTLGGGRNDDAPVSAARLATLMRKAKANPRLGKLGADALSAAYRQARAAAKKNPSVNQLRDQIAVVTKAMGNDRLKSRVYDGYVDAREAAAIKGDFAAALYKLLDAMGRPTPQSQLKLRATHAQIDKAIARLDPIIEAGFKLHRNNSDPTEVPAASLGEAARRAGLSSAGRAALMTALNGATSRNDGSGFPGPADVKTILRNAQKKLKEADGAAIVDLARPERAPTKKKDKVTTGLEPDRTPAATGMTSRALLKYASTL
jgi:hypothetical protein